ncbi:hypothetical protein [Streptacidiphilus sp. EB103A]|uniref:hypothetical protein n=1 Tax=Streptacidiphilus sp. EB103A TaxID=3156275 RepID=UPI003512A627
MAQESSDAVVSVPEGAGRVVPAVAAVLRLSGRRERVVDEHMFRPGHGPRSAAFRLQLFTGAGLRPVAVATQRPGEGTGLTNAAERYAAAVWQRYFPEQEQPPVWVQRRLRGESAARAAVWELVTFARAEPFRLGGPRWRTLTDGQLAELVGQRVDPGRGRGYVPPVPVPEPELRFEAMAVRRLGRPEPFRGPGCMPAASSRWRRWYRWLVPTRRPRTCCWYHGGDWHTVSRLARQSLEHAGHQGAAAGDLAAHADRHALALGATVWQREALASLLDPADAIQPDGQGHYENGQHRAQALMDQGVRRTVVLRQHWPEHPA